MSEKTWRTHASVLRGERSARMRSRSVCVSVLAIKGQPSLSFLI